MFFYLKEGFFHFKEGLFTLDLNEGQQEGRVILPGMVFFQKDYHRENWPQDRLFSDLA